MVTDKNKITPGRMKRLALVEDLYLDEHCAKEIFEMIGEEVGVCYDTIRKDIQTIRAMWANDHDNRAKLKGGQRYQASLKQLRRKALETGDLKTVFAIDKEKARLQGFRLKSDEKTIHLDVQAARDFMKNVMAVVFKHVPDEEIQKLILKDIEALAAAGEE